MFPYKIRSDLQVNGDRRKLVLVTRENEKPRHLGLKLAAYLLFWDLDLIVEAGSKHPALMGQAFQPDILGTDITGSVSSWIECGETSAHKIFKVLRRWRDARVIVIKENRLQAERFRLTMTDRVPGGERVEILYWADKRFMDWMHCLSEKTEIIGEAGGMSFNLVINESVYVEDLKRC